MGIHCDLLTHVELLTLNLQAQATERARILVSSLLVNLKRYPSKDVTL